MVTRSMTGKKTGQEVPQQPFSDTTKTASPSSDRRVENPDTNTRKRSSIECLQLVKGPERFFSFDVCHVVEGRVEASDLLACMKGEASSITPESVKSAIELNISQDFPIDNLLEVLQFAKDNMCGLKVLNILPLNLTDAHIDVILPKEDEYHQIPFPKLVMLHIPSLISPNDGVSHKKTHELLSMISMWPCLYMLKLYSFGKTGPAFTTL